MSVGISEMMFVVGDDFVNYTLLRDIDKAYKAGVFPDKGIDNEDEDRYLSELERRMTALDDKSVYVAIKAFVKHHRKTVVRTLEYMEKEGEKNGVN